MCTCILLLRKTTFFKTTIDFGIQLHYSSSEKDFDLIKKKELYRGTRIAVL